MGAVISKCGRYRYRLDRELSAGPGSPVIAVIMVNPSTADATANDHTIRKLIGFGERHGWGKIIVGNLFAFRATDVTALGKVINPTGPDNDQHLIEILAECHQVVCAWGPVAKQPRHWRNRYQNVLTLIDGAGLDPYRIGETTKCGHPRHPLMIPYTAAIEPWSRPDADR